MKKAAVLLLIHQGFSFADDLIELFGQLGLQAVVLSSRIRSAPEARCTVLEAKTAAFRMIDRLSLSGDDVRTFLSDVAQGFEVVACLSVWEGYRVFMAEANLALGACDDSVEALRNTLDKHCQRELLRRAGLTRAVSNLLTPASCELDGAMFIKPRWGLGSFGAFKSNGHDVRAKLEQISAEMSADEEYAGVFSDDLEFVAETEIPGTEFSFEVIGTAEGLSVVAIHEKVDLEARHGSILENACVSPPPSLSEEQTKAGCDYVKAVLKALGLSRGCYHIEARLSSNGWDTIEVNPRVGGAYINHSTRWVSGECLLRLWIEALIPPSKWTQLGSARKLENLSPLVPSRGISFFRVYFGTPGSTISSFRPQEIGFEPAIVRQMAQAGTRLPNVSREIFLAQALWLLPLGSSANTIQTLTQRSQNYFEVQYE